MCHDACLVSCRRYLCAVPSHALLRTCLVLHAVLSAPVQCGRELSSLSLSYAAACVHSCNMSESAGAASSPVPSVVVPVPGTPSGDEAAASRRSVDAMLARLVPAAPALSASPDFAELSALMGTVNVRRAALQAELAQIRVLES